MKVEFKDAFIKSFRKRYSHDTDVQKRFHERLELFSLNPGNPILRDHPLKGTKTGFRSFSITGDIRVIYVVVNEIAYFIDIGTHNQVY